MSGRGGGMQRAGLAVGGRRTGLDGVELKKKGKPPTRKEGEINGDQGGVQWGEKISKRT